MIWTKKPKGTLGYTYTAPDVWHEIAMTHGLIPMIFMGINTRTQ
ncbi:MAG: hypothetical protein ACLT8V_00080 [Streptococcus salivarius]